MKPSAEVDRKIVTSDSWGGYADSTTFRDNVFYAPALQPSAFNLTKSTNILFEGNYYLGTFIGKPADAQGREPSTYYIALAGENTGSPLGLSFLFEEVTVGDGAAVMRAVKREVINDFFNKMESN